MARTSPTRFDVTHLAEHVGWSSPLGQEFRVAAYGISYGADPVAVVSAYAEDPRMPPGGVEALRPGPDGLGARVAAMPHDDAGNCLPLPPGPGAFPRERLA